MSNILYYSNYCDNCKNLLLKLNKYTNKNDTHFINIDNRKKDPSGNIILNLENGQSVIMPNSVSKVPALLILNENYRVIFGNDIISFLNIETYTGNVVDTKERVFENPQSEPTTFEWMSTSGVSSDLFSFLDTSPDELTAKGNGGERQMYNYTNMDYSSSINTPNEDYQANTIGNDGSSMENIQSQRENEIKGIYNKQQQF
jgi:hypothetical protein